MKHLSMMTLIAASLLAACSDRSYNEGNGLPYNDGRYRKSQVDYRGPWLGGVVQGDFGAWGYGSLDINLESCSWESESEYTACVDSISLDGLPVDDADLGAGQMVEFHGTTLYRSGPYGEDLDPLPPFTSAANGHIVLDIQRAIVGPVDSLQPQQLRMEVSGQSVYIDDTTVIALPNFDESLVGESVTVSGYIAPGGQILATRIEPYADSGPYLLRGILSDLAPNRFAIGGIEVDIASATRQNFPGGAPVSGDPVLVFSDQPPASGVLRRTAQDWVWSDASDPLDHSDPLGGIRGFVTAIRSANDIDVEGYRLEPSSYQLNGHVLNGSAAPSVGSFAYAEVEVGRVRVSEGYSTSSALTIAGEIEAIDNASRELSIFGIPIGLTPATQIYVHNDVTDDYPPRTDVTDVPSPLSFEDLIPGEKVTVKGGLRWPAGRWVAGSIVRSVVDVGNRINAAQEYSIDNTGLYPVVVIAGHSILTDEYTSATVCGDATSLVDAANLQDKRNLTIYIAPDTAPPLATALYFGCGY